MGYQRERWLFIGQYQEPQSLQTIAHSYAPGMSERATENVVTAVIGYATIPTVTPWIITFSD